MKPKVGYVLVLVGAAAGFWFASVSTSDFVEHLDRKVHSIHCSFIPGGGIDATGTSGCHATLMSPYSSFMRTRVWGGVPIALPAMSVFAFLVFWVLYIRLSKRTDRESHMVLLGAAIVPLVTSLIMGYIALVELDAACKLCIGIYLASAMVFAGAVMAWLHLAKTNAWDEMQGRMPSGADGGLRWTHAVALAVASVVVPLFVYLVATPDFSKFVASCGALEQPVDSYNVMVPLDGRPQGIAAVEVLDPLCAACRGFEARLRASRLDEQLQRRALLFPLDNTCNWMVGSAVHPGACMVSEAVLCAESRANEVLAWAFDHQEALRQAAAKDVRQAEQLVKGRFPELGTCIGSAGVRAKLNRSLRWAVANHLPVLTPQLYVQGVKLCDEDTDLGMDYTLSRLIERASSGGAR
jgi:uncharacterized membrane protein